MSDYFWQRIQDLAKIEEIYEKERLDEIQKFQQELMTIITNLPKDLYHIVFFYVFEYLTPEITIINKMIKDTNMYYSESNIYLCPNCKDMSHWCINCKHKTVHSNCIINYNVQKEKYDCVDYNIQMRHMMFTLQHNIVEKNTEIILSSPSLFIISRIEFIVKTLFTNNFINSNIKKVGRRRKKKYYLTITFQYSKSYDYAIDYILKQQ